MGCVCTKNELVKIINHVFPELLYNRMEKESILHMPPQGNIHEHDMYEIYLNLGDPIQYVTEERIVELPFGGVVITPPHVKHYAYTNAGNIYHRMRLHIAPQLYDIAAHYQPSLRSPRESQCRMAVLSDDPMKQMQIIENTAEKCRPTTYLPLVLVVLQLIQQIDIQMEQNGLQEKKIKQMPHLLWDILQYIHQDENYLRITSNREIAQKFFITESYLSRMFQQYMPVTAHRYLLGLKINHAKSLLMKGVSVTEACYAVGFSDCSHFIVIYRQYTGETPGSTGRQHIVPMP